MDDDNKIETKEVQTAIKDWSSNQGISAEELIRLIELWMSGETIGSS
jgi:hypothetical protein